MTRDIVTNFAAGCSNINDVCLKNLPKTAANGSFVETVIAIIIGATAAISVLFIVIGGLRYVLSQGDPQGVSKAKATVVYALIGLVVAILAQVIVVFIINGIS